MPPPLSAAQQARSAPPSSANLWVAVRQHTCGAGGRPAPCHAALHSKPHAWPYPPPIQARPAPAALSSVCQEPHGPRIFAWMRQKQGQMDRAASSGDDDEMVARQRWVCYDTGLARGDTLRRDKQIANQSCAAREQRRAQYTWRPKRCLSNCAVMTMLCSVGGASAMIQQQRMGWPGQQGS